MRDEKYEKFVVNTVNARNPAYFVKNQGQILLKRLGIHGWAFALLRHIYLALETLLVAWAFWGTIKTIYGLKHRITHPIKYEPRIGLHTVFIARENVMFLEEWIKYHRMLGVDYFYLYDNSKVEVTDTGNHLGVRATIAEYVAKRGIPYNEIVTMTQEDINFEIERIRSTIPGVYFYEWSPEDENGVVGFFQVACQNEALAKHKDEVDWMLFTDIDEFLDIKKPLPDICRDLAKGGYDGAVFAEVPMDSRWSFMGTPTTDITKGCKYHKFFNKKILCYLPRTFHVNIHMFRSVSAQKHFSVDEVNFRHYRCIHKDDDYAFTGDDELKSLPMTEDFTMDRPGYWERYLAPNYVELIQNAYWVCHPIEGTTEALAEGDSVRLEEIRAESLRRQYQINKHPHVIFLSDPKWEYMYRSKFDWRYIFR